MTYATRCCGALLLLVPALAAAQDQTPSPPKQETVSIRAVGGSFEIKGASAANFFEFTQRCESRNGIAESSVTLTLPLELEVDPNDSLEHATTVLREAAAKSTEVSVESSSEAGKVAMFYWFGSPVFKGVIESVSVKYTLFLPSGTPVRATASLRFSKPGRAGVKNKKASESSDTKNSDCPPSQ